MAKNLYFCCDGLKEKKHMKHFILSLVALMAVLAPAKADNDRPIPPEQLPDAAKTFIQQTFPQASIAYAEIEQSFAKTKYEARLNDGTKVEFNGSGVWDKVDCQYRAVPAQLIPEVIAKYVQATYAGALITKIDKELYGYEIELNNGLDLKFSSAGQLLEIDD